VENQEDKKIKVLIIENGGEFRSKEFEQFSKQCGIARQNTTPYTPQNNGVAKRMHRMLMEKERRMLSSTRLRQ
jgi:transposase InsO family protein